MLMQLLRVLRSRDDIADGVGMALNVDYFT